MTESTTRSRQLDACMDCLHRYYSSNGCEVFRCSYWVCLFSVFFVVLFFFVFLFWLFCFFFFSSRRRHTRYGTVTGVQTCALPILCTRERFSPHSAPICYQWTYGAGHEQIFKHLQHLVIKCMIVQTLCPKGQKFTCTRSITWRSEERRVGKECRSRWSPYH